MPARKKRKGGKGAIATAGTDDPETNTETRKGNQDTASPIVIRIANPNTVGGGGGSTSLSATDLANAKRAVAQVLLGVFCDSSLHSRFQTVCPETSKRTPCFVTVRTRTLRGPRKRIKLLPPHLNYLQVVLLLVHYHDLVLGLERRPMSAPTIQHTDHARYNGVDAFFVP